LWKTDFCMGATPSRLNQQNLRKRGIEMDAKTFIATLPAWDGNSHLSPLLDKDAVLAAEVKLPVPPGFTGRLGVVSVRRPYSAQIKLIAVDVCRLTAP
jgi:hypothetical protein